MFKVAIIGRPNVGKSTLFNRLVKRNLAIVHNSSGTTRDIKEYRVDTYAGFSFKLLDTAGLEKADIKTVAGRMTDKTLTAIKTADIILFMIEAQNSVIPEDIEFARIVKKYNKKVILLVNKSENLNNFKNNIGDFYKLGFDRPLPISAEHGQGMVNLIDTIHKAILDLEKLQLNQNNNDISESETTADDLSDMIEILDDDTENENTDEEETDFRVRIAIIGRPNVGKSTLVNSLLGENRMLTGDEAGLTRDAIDTDFTYKGRDVKLIDTAGLRKKAKIYEELERLSTARSIETIKNSDVCVIVIDATTGLDKQDLTIGSYAVSEGKGLIFLLNKWDLVKNKRELKNEIKDKLSYSFYQVKNIPIITVSALKNKGTDDMMREVFELYDLRKQRITTGKLNKWLLQVIKKNPPPLSRLKRPMNIKYITQSATRPPTFTMFVGGASILPDNYTRYLINSLGEEFGFDKIAIRLKVKTQKNPYKDKK